MHSLEGIFRELGIAQYLDAFVDQGFDSWEVILDITESDLDALGVKLGHRRKLQRRIANSRGLAPAASLVSPTRTSIEDGRPDANQGDRNRSDTREPVIGKRKYRRHPKPDENAPERPPSAYVLFSNKMREDLKGRNLTFTEIAKLVGENWQSLSRSEKEPFETSAHDAKERYNRDLNEYKKTTEYRKYSEYLQDFRKRQAAQAQEKDASKRLKTESDAARSTSVGTGGTTSMAGSGSSSDSLPGSEPPPSRRPRVESGASDFPPSLNGTHSASMQSNEDSLRSPQSSVADDTGRGRSRGLSSPKLHELTSVSHPQRLGDWREAQRMSIDAASNSAPSWLSAPSDPRGSVPHFSHSPENSLPSLTPSNSEERSSLGSGSGSGRGSRSSGSASASRPPSLKTEQSSAGSMSSTGSYNLPRTPSEASLPIHALLSSKPEPSFAAGPPPLGMPPSQMPNFKQSMSARPGDASNHARQSPNNGFLSASPPMVMPQGFTKDPGLGRPADLKAPANGKVQGAGDSGLDGISALLKAREIVDRRPR